MTVAAAARLSLFITRRLRLPPLRITRQHAFSTSPFLSQSPPPPLVHISKALIPGLKGSSTFNYTINDTGKHEAWAVVGPTAEKGGAVKAHIVKALMGTARLERLQDGNTSEPTLHPKVHPQPNAPTFSLVSFSSRLSSISGASTAGSAFVDFSSRYGAIRDEDRITLYESIMESMGTKTGLIAKTALVHDPLVDAETEAAQDYAQGITRLPWSSPQAEQQACMKAKQNHEKVLQFAPLLKLDEGEPVQLLFKPVIALSNGQTRRARILTALCTSPDVLVLEEPFTGLDPPTRIFLADLLADLHASKAPRILCVLREQDDLPHFVTHVLSIGQEGEILFQGQIPLDRSHINTAADLAPAEESQTQQLTSGGYERVKEQAQLRRPGLGDEDAVPVVQLNAVTVAYKDIKILDSISLTLPPGSRTILVGDNGSGKTTLLSLLTGSHPRSYSFEAPTLSLFGEARSAPQNATPLLLRRLGQLSPELVNSFPRFSLDRGGLTVEEAIGTGFEGIFSRRPLTEEQRLRVRRLVQRFEPVVTSRSDRRASGTGTRQAQSGDSSDSDSLDRLLGLPLISLTPGSQVLILFLRAVIQQPTLLILDEPFQGMSAAQVDYVRTFLDCTRDSPTRRDFSQDEWQQEQQWFSRMAWIVVSHFDIEWPVTAARLIRLDGGKVVERI